MENYTVSYLKEVLDYELRIRGYRKIKMKKKKETLEIKADGLKSYVYNLDLINPFGDISEIVMSVIRQLSLDEIDRGGKM